MIIFNISNKNSTIPFFKKTQLIISQNPILTYGFFTLIITILLNWGIFKDYAFRDSYEYIWTAGNKLNFKDEFIQGGRFLLGIIFEFVYHHSNSIANLKWVRLFSLLTSVIFSIQVFSFLLNHKMKINEAALFSFLILTIPSFTVYIGWSATFEIPLLLSLSFFSGQLLLKALDKKKVVIFNYLIPLILVLISLCTYQSAAMAFLLPFIFRTILYKKIDLKKLIYLIFFSGIAFILFYCVFKIALNWYNLAPSKRTDVSIIKLPLNIILFFLKDLRMVFYGSGILTFSKLFFAVGVFSFLGFFYLNFLKKDTKQPFYIFLFFFILILPLSFAPNILSSTNYTCSRSIGVTAIIVLFYQFIFLKNLSSKNIIFRRITLTFVLLTIVVSAINQNIYISKIQNTEYFSIKKAFNEIPLNNTKKIIVIKPNEDFLQKYKYYKNLYADEFSQISSSRIWVPKPIFNQLKKERLDSLNFSNNNYLEDNVAVFNTDDKYDDTNAIVINLVDILEKAFNDD